MARLIDADELYRKLEEIRMDYLEEDSMNSNFAANVIECMQDVYLKDMPIIKAERYGHWTLIKDIFCYYSCSECGNNVQYESRFCPYCGAVMKDDVKNNKPLSFADLLRLDGEPVWGVFGSDGDTAWWCLVEVGEEGEVWLTNNLGGRSAFCSDDDVADMNITLYSQFKKESLKNEDELDKVDWSAMQKGLEEYEERVKQEEENAETNNESKDI